MWFLRIIWRAPKFFTWSHWLHSTAWSKQVVFYQYQSGFDIFPKMILHLQYTCCSITVSHPGFSSTLGSFLVSFSSYLCHRGSGFISAWRSPRVTLTSIIKVMLPLPFSPLAHNHWLQTINPTARCISLRTSCRIVCPYYFMSPPQQTRSHNSYSYKCVSSHWHFAGNTSDTESN